MNPLLSLDQATFLALNQLVDRIGAVDSLALLIIEMPLVKLTVLVALFWGVWFAARGEGLTERSILVKSAIGILVAMLTARLLQNLLPRRARPLNADLPGLRYPGGADPERFAGLADWSSMPSDHAVVAFAVATAIYARNRLLGWFAFAWAAVVICLPRVYLGRHFPGDIIVGAAIGIGIVVLLARQRALDPVCRQAFQLEARVPAVFYFAVFVVSQQLATMFDDVRRIGAMLGRIARAAGLG